MIVFARAYALWCALVIGIASRLFLPLTAAAALAWTGFSAGVAPVAAVGLFLFSSFVAGRRILRESSGLVATLLGMAVFMTVIGAAVHFPINYPATYLALFLAPLICCRRATASCFRACKGAFRLIELDSPREYAAAALLGFVMLTQLLASLKPETSADALSMHLFIPWSVYFNHHWGFDFRHITWALMPMGADWLFTGVFMLGGENAPKLLNFGTLAILTGALYSETRRWLPAAAALVLAALFVSSPLVHLVTGSLFIENIQAAFLFGAVAGLWRFRETGSGAWLFASAALLGSGMATKFGSLTFAAPLAVFVVAEIYRQSRQIKRNTVLAAGLFLLIALPPYATAYIKSGNPVFPFLNHVFRSPDFDSQARFLDGRWTRSAGLGTPFDVVFHTHRYLESHDGGFGFQYLLIVPLCLLALGRGWPYAGWSALAIGGVCLLLTFAALAYARYIYAALPLLAVIVALILYRLSARDPRFYRCLLGVCVATTLLNVYFMPASGFAPGDFFLKPLDPAAVRNFEKDFLPVRSLIKYLNDRHPNEPAAVFESAQVAGLKGAVFLDGWHTYPYSKRMREKPSAVGYLRLVQQLGIRYFIAPNPDSGIPIQNAFVRPFLDRYTEPEYAYGAYSVSRLKGELPVPSDAEVSASMPPVRGGCTAASARDDLEGNAIQYFGPWTHDNFPEASRGTVSYTAIAGAGFQFAFTGSQVTWVYTKAPNRGRGDVEIDGTPMGTVDLYSPEIQWQSEYTIRTSLGSHMLRVTAQGAGSKAATGSFIDVDCLAER